VWVGSPCMVINSTRRRGQFEQLIKMYAGQAQLSPAHVTTMACNGMGGPTIDIMDRPYLDIQTCHQHHTLKGAYDGSGFFESIHFGHHSNGPHSKLLLAE
jgi:hypothetical protein